MIVSSVADFTDTLWRCREEREGERRGAIWQSQRFVPLGSSFVCYRKRAKGGFGSSPVRKMTERPDRDVDLIDHLGREEFNKKQKKMLKKPHSFDFSLISIWLISYLEVWSFPELHNRIAIFKFMNKSCQFRFASCLSPGFHARLWERAPNDMGDRGTLWDCNCSEWPIGTWNRRSKAIKAGQTRPIGRPSHRKEAF